MTLAIRKRWRVAALFLAIVAVLGLSMASHPGIAHAAVAAPATAATHASPPPPIPGCGGGQNFVDDNVHTNWSWWEQGESNGTFIVDGSVDNAPMCAVAEAGGWQEIRDIYGNCLGVDGLSGVYLKPCAATRAFDLWTSGSSPISNLLIQNDWVNQNYSCSGTTLKLVISSDGTDGDNVLMKCPAYSGAGYALSQTWDWIHD